MRSMRVDCGTVRIGSDDELDDYMDGSAGSVGRIMAPLLGVPERFHADFGQLGQAFQLTNFIRDVGEDWADGPDLPPRARRGRSRRGPRHAAAARRRRPAGGAGARAVRRRRARRGRGAGLGAERHPAGLRRLRADPRPRRGGRRRRARPPRRRPRAATCRGCWRRSGGDAPGDAARRRADAARRSAPTCWCAARASPGWPSRASWRAAGPTCWWSTATRSASAPPRPARRRRRGCTRWASSARSARSCRAWPSTRRTARPASGCRGAGRASTTASCARRCGSSATRGSRSRRWSAATASWSTRIAGRSPRR